MNDRAWWWSTLSWRHYEKICGISPPRAAELPTYVWQTRVIDLTLDDTQLWRDVRKSYKPLIHRAERAYQTWAIREDLEPCRLLHARVAGRETRPKASWELMQDWVSVGTLQVIAGGRTGFSALVNASADRGSTRRASTTELLGFVAVYEWESHAYLGHLASCVDDLNTMLTWKAIAGAKSRGMKTFEVGWQGQATDQKGQQIEFWRRGFGGEDRPANLSWLKGR